MRIDMYLLPATTAVDDAALRLACQLTGKAWPGHRHISICCQPQQQEQLDAMLWQIPADRFIAHGISGSAAAAQAPVQISSQPQAASLLIQLQDSVPATANLEQYQRILDIIGASEQQRQAGRERYRNYQQLSGNINIHRLQAKHSSA